MLRERRIDSVAAVLAFLARHGEGKVVEDEADWFGQMDGKSVVEFTDGARLTVITDYEPGYSEYTPGAGFTVVILGLEDDGS